MQSSPLTLFWGIEGRRGGSPPLTPPPPPPPPPSRPLLPPKPVNSTFDMANGGI